MQVLGSDGAVSASGATLNTTTGTPVYTTPWRVSAGSVFSTHVEFAGGSSLTTGITLWVSNKYDPSLTNDNDWVQETSITYTGISSGTSAKEAQAVGNAGFKWYRLKLVTTNGSGKASVWVELTDLGRS